MPNSVFKFKVDDLHLTTGFECTIAPRLEFWVIRGLILGFFQLHSIFFIISFLPLYITLAKWDNLFLPFFL